MKLLIELPKDFPNLQDAKAFISRAMYNEAGNSWGYDAQQRYHTLPVFSWRQTLALAREHFKKRGTIA